MDEIAEQFKACAKASPGQPASETTSPVEPSDSRFEPTDTHGSERESSRTAQAIFGPLCLSPDQIEAPSFFVDKKLSVLWMNPIGTDAFSHALAVELRSAPTRNIFDLLLRPAIKASIDNWQAFFSFVYILLRRSTDRDTFDRQTVFISKNHLPITGDDTAFAPAIHPFLVDSCVVGRNDAATDPPLRIFGLEFKEGTLFLLRKDQWHTAVTVDGTAASAVGDIGPVDEKKPICILSARLNDSHRIADTMLPEIFFELMHRIWDESDRVVRSFGGRRAGCSGAQIDYMFTESAGRNPIFSAICCATRMNRQMQAMEAKIKSQEGWADEIRLNMGISHGTDEVTTPDPTGCMESMVPGGTFDQSSRLSVVAGKGEIWITKNAVAQLPKKLIDQVVVGIDRQGRFFRNFFTRLSDLPQGSAQGQPKSDLGTLTIARILTIDKQRPDQLANSEV
jgi:class 3 adenylate cyclase